MKSITVKFNFNDLEGYEDTDDELIIEDHLRGCKFDDVGFEIMPGWISVKDQLPEDPGEYFICFKKEVKLGTFYPGLGWYFNGIPRDKVTHWMALPIAPAKE